MLLHHLWVTGEVSTIRYTRRIGAEKSGRRQLKRREAMEQASTEEVKMPA